MKAFAWLVAAALCGGLSYFALRAAVLSTGLPIFIYLVMALIAVAALAVCIGLAIQALTTR
jgi:hypothetical protein